MEEIFNRIEKDDLGQNIFDQTEEEVIDILCNSKIRNARHIRYLSKTKHSELEKIKFSIRPKFGFLFCIHGANQSHFVLELLNSNATYIWSFDTFHGIEKSYRAVNEEIGKIEGEGRQKYKSELAGNNFHCLFHKGIETNPEQGFQEWKNELISKTI